MKYSADIKKPERYFLPDNFTITTWENLEPYFKDLAERKISSGNDLEKWLKDSSELEAVVSEEVSWRQIRMTCDTENKSLEEAFVFFMTEIQPKIQPYADQLNRKLIDCSFTEQLDKNKYFTYLRSIKKNIQLFREENIPLFSELSILGQQYGVISGKMTVNVNGNEYTLQQANKFLKDSDRYLREDVYRKIQERRLQDKDQLNELYSTLIAKRNQVALNAGFKNYRDYKFVELGRFDYTKEDCFQFHESVKQYVLPLANLLNEKKRKKLGLEKLRPWDTEAEPAGIKPLHPFKTGNELIEKTISCFSELNPFFADCLSTMKKMGRLDLE